MKSGTDFQLLFPGAKSETLTEVWATFIHQTL